MLHWAGDEDADWIYFPSLAAAARETGRSEHTGFGGSHPRVLNHKSPRVLNHMNPLGLRGAEPYESRMQFFFRFQFGWKEQRLH